ncbi:hypothetical protein [Nocardia sp. NPDC058497]|uniref:hypothetical protein n=1 Tax=Nocardia sp. NPDC058497 TaxID=3346529 RepID=UPI0036630BDD
MTHYSVGGDSALGEVESRAGDGGGAGIVHGMRTPDPALTAVYSHAVRRLFIDGVRVAAR